jgi:hypothetical protein
MAGWIHFRQLEVIDFLREENRVLREQLGRHRGRRGEELGARAVRSDAAGINAADGLCTPAAPTAGAP